MAEANGTAPVPEAPAITHKTPARVGLCGNPSDQFQGKVVAFALANYYATVRLRVGGCPGGSKHAQRQLVPDGGGGMMPTVGNGRSVARQRAIATLWPAELQPCGQLGQYCHRAVGLGGACPGLAPPLTPPAALCTVACSHVCACMHKAGAPHRRFACLDKLLAARSRALPGLMPTPLRLRRPRAPRLAADR